MKIPTPQVLIPKISRLDVFHDRGIIHILVDGQQKLAMNSEQATEFAHILERKAYEAQAALNADQARMGDPTVYCKKGSASIGRALVERWMEKGLDLFRK